MDLQGGDTAWRHTDKAFFIWTSQRDPKALTKKPGHHKKNRDREYINELKSRTRCYNCGRLNTGQQNVPNPDMTQSFQTTNQTNMVQSQSQRACEVQHALQPRTKLLTLAGVIRYLNLTQTTTHS